MIFAIMLAASEPIDANWDRLRMAAEAWQVCAVNKSVDLFDGSADSANAVAEQSADSCGPEKDIVYRRGVQWLSRNGQQDIAGKADAIVFEFRAVIVRKIREQINDVVAEARRQVRGQ